MPETGKRAAARARTMQRITEIGLAQLDVDGVAGLSLREVARELGMVSSAVYRYVASRDELLTLLLVEAFNDLAATITGADGAAAELDAEARFGTVARRMRTWALAHPERWNLLYGTPVRGYAAPDDRTTEPGTRVMALFGEIAVAADPQAWAGLTVPQPAEPFLVAAAEAVRPGVQPAAVGLAMTLWSATVGAISAELFGQWGELEAPAAEALFEVQLGALGRLLRGAE